MKFLSLITLLACCLTTQAADIHLPPSAAVINGPSGKKNLTIDGKLLRYWYSTKSSASWTINVKGSTTVDVFLDYAHGRAAGSEMVIECAGQKLQATSQKTKDWNTFVPLKFGSLKLTPGKHTLTLRATKSADHAVLDTTGIRLTGANVPVAVKQNIKPFSDAAGFQQKLKGPHPSMKVTDLSIPGLEIKVGGIGFLSDGTMVVCSWTSDGSVYFIKGYDGDPKKMRIKKFATGIAEPLGISIVEDRIFVCQKQELTELIDSDKDGVCDIYRCVSNAWEVDTNFHQFTFGPVYHDGKFYLNLAVAINPGGATTVPQVKDRGTCIAVDPDTGAYEVIAAGLRTPNGITITSKGQILVSDNQGDYLPANKMMHIRPGKFFNNKYKPEHPWASRPVSPPVVWQAQNEIGNSPTEPIEIPSGPFKGQILHGDIHHGGLKRVFMEEINGQLQGVVFRHAQNLRGGINRLEWGPDGNLYAGVAGHRGNWGNSKRDGLLRIEYNKPLVFEMAAVRAKSDGLEIEFTKPLAIGQGWDPGYYKIDSWTYKPNAKYGGPKVDQHTLTPETVSVSEDRKRVFLKMPQMKTGYVTHIVLNRELQSDDGQAIYSGECWYNLNEKPAELPGEIRPLPSDALVLGEVSEEKLSRVEVLHKTFCISCHTTDGKKLVGPSFKGLLGKKQKIHRDGKVIEVTVDEEYIRRSILNPAAEYPDGYQPIMPQTLSESFSKEDTEKLVQWIKGLK
ncbi:hypothetical protein NT6N_13820 [Oceaniferula spumae]|uniref:Cytochrome c domain-containing protein n=1 Tax=Oceaniferula spumae TaxID=2979115 RepID=A0AAT9FK57_9BACT